ncbi:Rap1-interacting factor 1 N terminal-domain-containing protein [Thamnocephalis sphaerospora]|uniref:Rap1-interacting factor 1 N terminal-domain-containing protein n=1 Tax=Thamnocephalis sphaerospora TaxID=78915 RepID=A0A4P9XXB4_9FUNG|nr:Rap1-interacting factor 1 N terminal-domain-containing protein [Thamnocephalis sphaerospora]|eukprot:RKP11083.1 Rap1-interacting factor 1 N terminal-domain-containing protein [Thamnocephalis sphaerospora]
MTLQPQPQQSASVSDQAGGARAKKRKKNAKKAKRRSQQSTVVKPESPQNSLLDAKKNVPLLPLSPPESTKPAVDSAAPAHVADTTTRSTPNANDGISRKRRISPPTATLDDPASAADVEQRVPSDTVLKTPPSAPPVHIIKIQSDEQPEKTLLCPEQPEASPSTQRRKAVVFNLETVGSCQSTPERSRILSARGPPKTILKAPSPLFPSTHERAKRASNASCVYDEMSEDGDSAASPSALFTSFEDPEQRSWPELLKAAAQASLDTEAYRRARVLSELATRLSQISATELGEQLFLLQSYLTDVLASIEHELSSGESPMALRAAIRCLGSIFFHAKIVSLLPVNRLNDLMSAFAQRFCAVNNKGVVSACLRMLIMQRLSSSVTDPVTETVVHRMMELLAATPKSAINHLLDRSPKKLCQLASIWLPVVLSSIASRESFLRAHAENLLMAAAVHFSENPRLVDAALEMSVRSASTWLTDGVEDVFAPSDVQLPRILGILAGLFGTKLHGKPLVQNILRILEGSFNSKKSAMRTEALRAWRMLIYNFSLEDHINTERCVQLIQRPIITCLRDRVDQVQVAAAEAWVALLHALGENVPKYFSTVVSDIMATILPPTCSPANEYGFRVWNELLKSPNLREKEARLQSLRTWTDAKSLVSIELLALPDIFVRDQLPVALSVIEQELVRNLLGNINPITAMETGAEKRCALVNLLVRFTNRAGTHSLFGRAEHTYQNTQAVVVREAVILLIDTLVRHLPPSLLSSTRYFLTDEARTLAGALSAAGIAVEKDELCTTPVVYLFEVLMHVGFVKRMGRPTNAAVALLDTLLTAVRGDNAASTFLSMISILQLCSSQMNPGGVTAVWACLLHRMDSFYGEMRGQQLGANTPPVRLLQRSLFLPIKYVCEHGWPNDISAEMQTQWCRAAEHTRGSLLPPGLAKEQLGGIIAYLDGNINFATQTIHWSWLIFLAEMYRFSEYSMPLSCSERGKYSPAFLYGVPAGRVVDNDQWKTTEHMAFVHIRFFTLVLTGLFQLASEDSSNDEILASLCRLASKFFGKMADASHLALPPNVKASISMRFVPILQAWIQKEGTALFARTFSWFHDMWHTTMLRLAFLEKFDTRLLERLSDLLERGLTCKDDSIARETMVFWQKTFCIRRRIVRPASLKVALKAAKMRNLISPATLQARIKLTRETIDADAHVHEANSASTPQATVPCETQTSSAAVLNSEKALVMQATATAMTTHGISTTTAQPRQMSDSAAPSTMAFGPTNAPKSSFGAQQQDDHSHIPVQQPSNSRKRALELLESKSAAQPAQVPTVANAEHSLTKRLRQDAPSVVPATAHRPRPTSNVVIDVPNTPRGARLLFATASRSLARSGDAIADGNPFRIEPTANRAQYTPEIFADAIEKSLDNAAQAQATSVMSCDKPNTMPKSTETSPPPEPSTDISASTVCTPENTPFTQLDRIDEDTLRQMPSSDLLLLHERLLRLAGNVTRALVERSAPCKP